MTRMRLAFIGGLVALALLAGAIPAVAAPGVPAAAQVTLDGAVTAQGTSQPISGANVAIFWLSNKGVWSQVATKVTGSAGEWTHAGKTGSYRFEISAAGHESTTITRDYPSKGTYAVEAVLVPIVVPQYATITGRVVRYATEVPLSSAYVWFYKQNADGSWPPTSPGWGSPTKEVFTDVSGNYTSGDLDPGTYKVRFFTVHTGSQWWQYVSTVDAATVVELAAPGVTVAGIDGWFGKP